MRVWAGEWCVASEDQICKGQHTGAGKCHGGDALSYQQCDVLLYNTYGLLCISLLSGAGSGRLRTAGTTLHQATPLYTI